MQNDASLIVPFFKSVAVPDVSASKEAGRPIFRDEEYCEIRIAGDRNYAPTFPAHSVWRTEDGEEITYAMRFKAEYERFAEGKEQIADGTPLSELPFLTEAKRAGLRASKVYTAEALASLDGKKLATLGADAREMKNMATAYLERATGAAGVTAMAAELEAMRAELAAMRGGAEPITAPPTTDYAEAQAKEDLKAQIADLTGSRPRGNPSLSTLQEMLNDMKASA